MVCDRLLWPHFSTGEEMDVTFSINSIELQVCYHTWAIIKTIIMSEHTWSKVNEEVNNCFIKKVILHWSGIS